MALEKFENTVGINFQMYNSLLGLSMLEEISVEFSAAIIQIDTNV